MGKYDDNMMINVQISRESKNKSSVYERINAPYSQIELLFEPSFHWPLLQSLGTQAVQSLLLSRNRVWANVCEYSNDR